MEHNPDVISIQDAARMLSVSHMTIRRLIAAGKLPAGKVGRQWRIKRVDVERLLEPPAKQEAPEDDTEEAPELSAAATDWRDSGCDDWP
jgi:excisionase family DNA binding protein